MVQDHQEVVDVARLFTAGIEKAMATNKLGHASNSTERHRARHEAVAQYLLDHILRQEGELDRFLTQIGVHVEHEPVLYDEWKNRETGSRFDHVIDDRLSGTEYRSVVVVEDKLDAQLAPDQLDRYCEFLAGENGPGTVVVLHPQRNPLTTEQKRVPALQKEYDGVTVKFMTWSALSSRMIEANQGGRNSALWIALAEFAESVGTGDLTHLPNAASLTDPSTARELRDLFLTMQNVAARVGGRSRQLRFSLHGGNTSPWLQMAMSDHKRASVGLELGLVDSPGTLFAGVRGPEDPEGYLTPSKVGVFKDGVLSAAAERRADELAELAVAVRDRGAHFPDRLPGRTTGKPVSEDGQKALHLLGSIFQAQALKNPHRGGAPSRRTRGICEGDGNERLGAVLVRDDEELLCSLELFIGPPAGHDWERCTIWIRDDESEREIEVLPGESGREYVLRVWQESRRALGG